MMSSAPKAKIVAALYATYGTITVICSNRSLKILIMRNEVIGSPPLLIIMKSMSFTSGGI